MTTTYDPPISAGSGETRPPSPWPGGYDAGPGGPAGYGGGGEGDGRRGRSLRRHLLVAGVAFAVGVGTVWGLQNGASAPLTTAQIAAKVDPGLVDVWTTLGYQQARRRRAPGRC